MKFIKSSFNFSQDRLQRLLKLVFYACAGTLMILLTVFLVSLAQGYNYDFRTGEFNVQGMVIIDSTPSGASILINGESIQRQTPRRRLISAGTHDFALQHPDYRLWQKSAVVLAGKVTFLEYPLLILNNIVTDNLLSAPQVTTFTPSPNGRLAVLSPDGESLQLLDTRSQELEEIFHLDEVLDSGQIVATQWAADNRRLLVRAQAADSTELLVLDTANPDSRFSLSQELEVGAGEIYFSQTSWQELFWLNRGNLRYVDIGEGVVSPVLARGVSDLSAGEEVFYLTTGETTGHVYRLNPDLSSELITDELESGSYQLAQLDDGDELVLAALNTTTRSLVLYNLSKESEPRTMNFRSESMLPSPNGQFLLLQNGRDFAVFHNETKVLRRFTLEDELSDLRWAGEFHLSAVAGDKAVLFEYDGANLEEIVSAEAGSGVIMAPNSRYLYSIGTSALDDGQVLQVSQLQD